MRRPHIFIVLLLIAALLSACAPLRDAQAEKPESSSTIEPAPESEASTIQASEIVPTDTVQSEETSVLEKEKVVQQYETPLDLELKPAETMPREEYFSELRNEMVRNYGWRNFSCSPGIILHDDEFTQYDWHPEVADAQLYLYKVSRVGATSKRRLLEIWELPGAVLPAPESEDIWSYQSSYGRTFHRIYYISQDRTSLMQADPEHGISVQVYSSDGAIWDVTTGRNIIVFTEQTESGTWRTVRLYEPDGNMDTLADNLPIQPSVDIISNCEFLISWMNTEYMKLDKQYAKTYWEEVYFTAGTPYPGDEESYYKTDFREHFPELLYEDFGVLYGWERYINTLTNQSWTIGYVPACGMYAHYYLANGTRWEIPENVEDHGNTPCFWLYLSPDDAS